MTSRMWLALYAHDYSVYVRRSTRAKISKIHEYVPQRVRRCDEVVGTGIGLQETC